MGTRFAILIGVAAAGVMACGAQTAAAAPNICVSANGHGHQSGTATCDASGTDSVALANGDNSTGTDHNKATLQPEIVNGTNATLAQAPWNVFMAYYDPQHPGRRTWCSGSVISYHWVLTASHCVRQHETGPILPGAQNFRIRVNQTRGGWNFVPLRMGWAGVYQADYVTTDPYYSGRINGGEDYTLIHVRQTIRARGYLPVNVGNPVYFGDRVFGFGYGAHTYSGKDTVYNGPLQYGAWLVQKNSACSRLFGVTFTGQREFCVGDPQRLSQSCFGDSGGPLVRYTNGNPLEIGVSSYSAKTCGNGLAVYAATSTSGWLYRQFQHFGLLGAHNGPVTKTLVR